MVMLYGGFQWTYIKALSCGHLQLDTPSLWTAVTCPQGFHLLIRRLYFCYVQYCTIPPSPCLYGAKIKRTVPFVLRLFILNLIVLLCARNASHVRMLTTEINLLDFKIQHFSFSILFGYDISVCVVVFVTLFVYFVFVYVG